ncbi:unnamed protein product [Echinostoma caproni]|uniref:BHLH domain-containing protein n=1 Tax=Echinostoma caproni TaxID=27848 RepID=A0A183A0G0_9TREM|nr:unnamed protein product [Echinostoma caproni]
MSAISGYPQVRPVDARIQPQRFILVWLTESNLNGKFFKCFSYSSLLHTLFRRDHHNQLERKRRASIKTSYNDLREAIPSLRGSKASRAVILQRAVEYIEELHKSNRDHTHCVETLRRQNDSLDSRVNFRGYEDHMITYAYNIVLIRATETPQLKSPVLITNSDLNRLIDLLPINNQFIPKQ